MKVKFNYNLHEQRVYTEVDRLETALMEYQDQPFTLEIQRSIQNQIDSLFMELEALENDCL